jgi:WD40 repeat protein
MNLEGAGVRVLLVGSGRHAPGSALPDVPAVQATVEDLNRCLIERSRVDPASLRIILDPETPQQLAAALAEAAARADRLLLFYYVGHGLLSPNHDLYLATYGTSELTEGMAAYQALPFAAVADALASHPVRSIVILDCCFSGAATLPTRSSYLLTSASGDELALAPDGERHTAFTGELVRFLTDGDAAGPPRFTIDYLYRHLAKALPDKGRPMPRQQAGDQAGDLLLAENAAYQSPSPAAAGPPAQELTRSIDFCPYRGLSPFDSQDAQWYFGRRDLVNAVIRRAGSQLWQGGPLVVTGPSGAGKSSLLRAGLQPALQDGALGLPGSGAWPQRVILPGEDPLAALATPLAELTRRDAGTIRQELADDPGSIVDLIMQVQASTGALILVVDQFEETFTLCSREDVRLAFIRALCAAAIRREVSDGAGPGQPAALVILGLRADFFGRCAAYPELVASLQDTQVVAAMSPDQLREAITEPARLAGLALEPGLVDCLLRDLGAGPGGRGIGGWDPGSLPLLSYALLATWQRREGRMLSVAGYQATGGIFGAVAAAGDAVYESLDGEDRDAARSILLRMIRVIDDVAVTRSRVKLSVLTEGTAPLASARRALAALVQARLVTVDEDSAEITHEALLGSWPLLRGWIDQDRNRLRIRQEVTDDAAAWLGAERDASLLYRGSRLALMRDQLGNPGPHSGLDGAAEAFLAASIRQQRIGRRRQTLVSVLTTLLVTALAASGVAFAQRQAEAVAAKASAASDQLAADSQALAASAPEISMLAAIDAYDQSPSASARGVLLSAQAQRFQSRLTGFAGREVLDAVFSPDGSMLATVSTNRSTGSGSVLQMWNARTHRMLSTYFRPRAVLFSAVFSPDGRYLVTGGFSSVSGVSQGQVIIWSPATGKPLYQLASTPGAVRDVSFSANGQILAAAELNGSVALWSWPDGHQLRVIEIGSKEAYFAAPSPTGSLLVTSANDGSVKLWNVASGRLLDILRHSPGQPDPLTFSSTGELAAGGPGDSSQLWQVSPPRLLGTLTNAFVGVLSEAFSPDGSTLAIANSEGSVQTFDTTTHNVLMTLPGLSGSVNSVGFSPDGNTIVAGGTGGSVVLWNVGGRILVAHPTDNAFALSCTEGCRRIATAEGDGVIRLWNRADGNVALVLADGTKTIYNVKFSPSGQFLAAASADGTVTVWNATTLQLLWQRNTGSYVDALAFNPASSELASGNGDGVIQIWNVSSGTQLASMGQSKNPVGVISLAFDPRNPELLASGTGGGDINLWNPETRELLAAWPAGSGAIYSVVFNPGGSLLATSSADNTARLWSPQTHRQLAVLGSNDRFAGEIAFSPDGDILAVPSLDRLIDLWNVRTHQVTASLTDPDFTMFAAAFAGQDSLVTTGVSGVIETWNLNTDQVSAELCQRIRASVSRPQWNQFLPNIAFPHACPAAG